MVFVYQRSMSLCSLTNGIRGLFLWEGGLSAVALWVLCFDARLEDCMTSSHRVVYGQLEESNP